MFRKFSIGGLVYSICSDEDLKLDSILEPFCTEENDGGFGNADCQLSIIKSKSEFLNQKSKIKKRRYFETDATWGLYELTNHDYQAPGIEYKPKILSVPSLKDGNRVRIFTEFDRDFINGIVYLSRSGWRSLLYPFLEVLTVNLLCRKNGVLLHACAVNDNGKGYLFVGQSGAGKSTTARLWSGVNGVIILSDDRIILRRINHRIYIYGTPWHGDAKECSPKKVPLEKVFFLKHAKENRVKRLNPLDAACRLIVCSFPTFWDKQGMELTLSFCSEIAQDIPCYELGFMPDTSITDFIKEKI
jgi:hypothetical protein